VPLLLESGGQATSLHALLDDREPWGSARQERERPLVLFVGSYS